MEDLHIPHRTQGLQDVGADAGAAAVGAGADERAQRREASSGAGVQRALPAWQRPLCLGVQRVEVRLGQKEPPVQLRLDRAHLAAPHRGDLLHVEASLGPWQEVKRTEGMSDELDEQMAKLSGRPLN